MKQTKKLPLNRESIRLLAAKDLRFAGGLPAETTAATRGGTDCPSEATGCHTGFSGCGSC